MAILSKSYQCYQKVIMFYFKDQTKSGLVQNQFIKLFIKSFT